MPSLWKAYARIPPPLRARVLGWKPQLAARLGPPPPWAECLPAGSQSSGEILGTLHALVQAGAAVENWPRVGLEAMAAGVPLVVDAKGGWKEMVRHGRTGYLCRDECEQAECAARLARDEDRRLDIACRARAALTAELAEPGAIWSQWRELLEGLS